MPTSCEFSSAQIDQISRLARSILDAPSLPHSERLDNAQGLKVRVALAGPAGQASILHFTDRNSGKAEILLTSNAGGSVLPDQHILFGSEAADVLTGFNNARGDRLYGGADHLEGGSGNDLLSGGAARDKEEQACWA